MLSGILAGQPRLPLLPPAQENALPLAIVPVPDDEVNTACVPFIGRNDEDAGTKLRTRILPGPLAPITPAGRALRRILCSAPDDFQRFFGYELLRSAVAGARHQPSVAEQAETLVLSVYARFLEHGDAPTRPSADRRAEFDEYARLFGGTAMKALERTTSRDFQVVVKAHVLGLVQNASFPNLTSKEAKGMYSSAMRFGYALRQAETRFLADGAAGTFVPLPLEAQLLREELEAMWVRPSYEGSSEEEEPDRAGQEGTEEATSLSQVKPPEKEPDEAAARRSLQEVLARLKRIGETRPGLATYLGWLGRFDPEALSMLATPPPVLAHAMRIQVSAVWGSRDDDVTTKVATTPSDMVEAALFGAWLRDAGREADESVCSHRQTGTHGPGGAGDAAGKV